MTSTMTPPAVSVLLRSFRFIVTLFLSTCSVWSITIQQQQVCWCCESFTIQPKRWEFLDQKHDIGYEVATPVTNNNNNNNIRSSTRISTVSSVLSSTNMTTSTTTSSTTTATTTEPSDISETRTPILLLNGFGVGSFHQHRLIAELFTNTNDSDNPSSSSSSSLPSSLPPNVYCMDYLGQGQSWPKNCQDGQSPNEMGLQYSAETWVQQTIQFIEQVIQPSEEDSSSSSNRSSSNRVHLVGNSVGGHLAAYIAARRPDLVESIVLLNPTPVWGLNLPGWTGQLPPPFIPRLVGRFLFDQIRNLNTIESFLVQTYSRREAFTDELMHQIRGCTMGNGGHAAFASIMWSPPLTVTGGSDSDTHRYKMDDISDDVEKEGTTKNAGSGSSSSSRNFQDCLSSVSCDVLLVFGKDDPWCKPAFAKKMLHALNQREPTKVHRYIEISNAGHCPNHEAPKAVGHVLKSWTAAVDDDRSTNSLVLVTDGQNVFEEEWGDHTVRECGIEDIQVGLMDRLATSFVS